MGCRTVVVGVLLAACLAAVRASAQDEKSLAADVAKQIVLDPTTYAPAALYFTSARLDWASSQPFFRNGITEHNRDFTISGRPDSTPLSYGAGNREIAALAVTALGTSIANNAAAAVFERVLVARHPRHRRLWHALSWIERVSFASYFGYCESALHFQQWQINRTLAAQRGYR